MKTRTFFLFIIASAITFFLMHRLLLIPVSFFQSTSSYLIYPFLKAQHMVLDPITQLFERRKNYHELQQSYAHLLAQNAELQARAIELQASLQFAQETRELVDFAKRYQSAEHQMAQILMRQFSDTGHFFLIDAGSNKGIKQDMIAVWQNVIVGRVSEVYPYYSKIVLVTDRSCRVACYCAKTGTCGIHEGVGKDNQTMLNFVSHLQKVETNDLLLSSGEGLIFPRGFAVGKIQGFSHDGVQYNITVAPLVNLHKLQFCYLLQKGAA